jgi:CheY-like chemotaxis protein
MLRVLVVEDDNRRVEDFRAWCPPDITLVHAKNGAAALGILERDRGDVFAGVMLDYDLQKQLYVEAAHLTGLDVARRIALRLSRDTMVLVHSMNPSDRGKAVALLEEAGFPVLQIPMEDLDRKQFLAWIAEVRENADD